MQYLKNEVREKILDAAIDEFTQQGYSNASIRNIAQTAEISLGNIYRYFSNKEALFLAITNPLVEKVKQFFKHSFDLGTLDTVAERMSKLIAENYSAVVVAFHGNKEQYEHFVDTSVEALAERLLDSVNANVADKKSFFRAIAASYIYGLTTLISIQNHEESIKEITRLTVYFFTDFTKRIV